MSTKGLSKGLANVSVNRAYPLQRVKHEVEAVAKLATNGGVRDKRILDGSRLEGCLEVLQKLSDSHH